MPLEMVTIRELDADGNLVDTTRRELMVRRPKDKSAYAAFPSSTCKRPLVSDHPPVIETRPPRVVPPLNLRDVLTAHAQAAAANGQRIRIVINPGG